MDLASAKVIGAGLAAIGVGAASIGVGYVFGTFVVQALNAHSGGGIAISILCFLFIMFVSMIELLVAAIQAYVFAILSSLYISEAVNLH